MKFFCVFVVLFLVLIHNTVDALNIWPKPQYESSGDETVSIDPSSFSIRVSGISPNDVLQSAIKRYHKYIFDISSSSIQNDIRISHHLPNNAIQVSYLNISQSLSGSSANFYPPLQFGVDESYTLTLKTDTFLLEAKTVWGALQGLETFSQLVSYYKDTYIVDQIPIVVHDHPRFSWRGLLIDTARHYLTTNALKKTIDAMTFNKMNTLHWHMTDAISFPLQVSKYPKLSEKGAYRSYAVYSRQDVSDVVEYGRLRGVRVVLEIDMPGHTGSWGFGYPHLVASCPSYEHNINNIALNPAVPETFDAVQKVIDEISQLSYDSFIHLGGDEIVLGCWAQDPQVKRFMKQKGFGKDFHRLVQYFEEQIQPFYQQINNQNHQNHQNNKTMVCWQDLVTSYGYRPPQDSIVQVWRSRETLHDIASDGWRGILSAGWYLANQDPPEGPHYSLWGSTWKNYYQNEPFAGSDKPWTPSLKERVVGGEACMWGEQVDDANIESRTWPRACAVAERLWSASNVTDLNDASKRLNYQRCRLVSRGIAASPISPGICDAVYAKEANLHPFRSLN